MGNVCCLNLPLRSHVKNQSKMLMEQQMDEDMDVSERNLPSAEFVIKPYNKARFRYPCEGRSAGSILGANSTNKKKTYPTIKINGLSEVKKSVVVIVSCVMEDSLMAHPHKLVGVNCHEGVYKHQLELHKGNNEITFKHVGIQCVTRGDVVVSLEQREALQIDPFNKGFAHKSQAKSLNLTAVRLCFQVFIPNIAGRVEQALAPVLSPVIYDRKCVSDLKIVQLSASSGPAGGGLTVILLCDKVTHKKVDVVFFQEERGVRVWEARAEVSAVHKQTAICFKTPPYRDPKIRRPVQVYLQLVRRADNDYGAPRLFEYYPQIDLMYMRNKLINSLFNVDVSHRQNDPAFRLLTRLSDADKMNLDYETLVHQAREDLLHHPNPQDHYLRSSNSSDTWYYSQLSAPSALQNEEGSYPGHATSSRSPEWDMPGSSLSGTSVGGSNLETTSPSEFSESGFDSSGPSWTLQDIGTSSFGGNVGQISRSQQEQNFLEDQPALETDFIFDFVAEKLGI